MTSVSGLLHVARAEIGYTEHPRGSNHTKFGVWYGIDPAPWCAMFASWCFWTAGYPLHVDSPKGFAYTPDGVAYAQHHNLWSTSGHYAPGDLVFYHWGMGRIDHVGIVVADDGTTMTTIEGNTGDTSQANGGAVMLRSRAHDQFVAGVFQTSKLLAGSGPSPAPHQVAPSWPGRNLALTSPFMRGSDVSTWQNQMRHRGWSKLNVDGVYGPSSAQVCRAFQKEKGLLVDGIVGSLTWQKSWTSPL